MKVIVRDMSDSAGSQTGLTEFSDPNDKIRNPASSLSNFKNRLVQVQDINVLGLIT